MFYDKEIELYRKGESTKNKYGGTELGNPIYIKTVCGDVQPYSSDLLKKEYGYITEVTNRVFIDSDADVIEGRIFKYNNKSYEIRKIIDWDDYMDVMIYGL
jgi:hypothetical protein